MLPRRMQAATLHRYEIKDGTDLRSPGKIGTRGQPNLAFAMDRLRQHHYETPPHARWRSIDAHLESYLRIIFIEAGETFEQPWARSRYEPPAAPVRRLPEAILGFSRKAQASLPQERVPPGSRAERVKGQWGEHYPILQSRFDMQRPGNRRKLTLLADLEALSQDAGLRLIHLAQAFPLSHPEVTLVIVGPRTLSQYDDMQAGFDTRLDSATLDRIDTLVAPGDLIEEADRGYVSPWMTSEARREDGGKKTAYIR